MPDALPEPTGRSEGTPPNPPPRHRPAVGAAACEAADHEPKSCDWCGANE